MSFPLPFTFICQFNTFLTNLLLVTLTLLRMQILQNNLAICATSISTSSPLWWPKFEPLWNSKYNSYGNLSISDIFHILFLYFCFFKIFYYRFFNLIIIILKQRIKIWEHILIFRLPGIWLDFILFIIFCTVKINILYNYGNLSFH